MIFPAPANAMADQIRASNTRVRVLVFSGSFCYVFWNFDLSLPSDIRVQAEEILVFAY